MKRLACPHCGFQNFEISAYCGRCERPLPSRKKKSADSPTPAPTEPTAAPTEPTAAPTEPTAAPTEPTPASTGPAPAASEPAPAAPPARKVASRAARLSVPPPVPPREELSPMPIESAEVLRAQEEAVYRRAEVRAATENLPEATETEPELDAIEAIEAAGALNLEDDHPGEIEVPVQLASGLQIALAYLVDVALVLAAGVGVVWLETVLFSTQWHTRSAFLVDIVADWVYAHTDATIHGAIATVVAGVIYNLLAGRRGGRTLGRLLTGTVLVRASGRSLTWWFLVLRMALSLVSLAFVGAGYFWALLDNQHRTWHDIITGTVVVRRRVRFPTTPR